MRASHLLLTGMGLGAARIHVLFYERVLPLETGFVGVKDLGRTLGPGLSKPFRIGADHFSRGRDRRNWIRNGK
jgi:hypothetical protein